jgi:hypothetical protein
MSALVSSGEDRRHAGGLKTFQRRRKSKAAASRAGAKWVPFLVPNQRHSAGPLGETR